MEWGYAARSLWRQLLRLKSVQELGVCYAKDIKAIQKGNRKFRKGKQVGSFSYDMLQNLLLEFRNAGLIGPRYEEDEGPYAGLEVFEVYGQKMHDELCHREGNVCRYIGWELPVFRQKGTQPGTQASEKGTLPGTQAGTQAFEKRYLSGYPSKTPQDSQNESDTPPSNKSDLRNAAPSQVSQLNHNNQAVDSPGQGEPENPKPKAAIDLSSRPDLTKTQNRFSAAPVPVVSVGTHIGKPVSIRQVSDGEIDTEQVDYNQWRTVEDVCRYVVEEWSAQPFLGRATLGDIMGEVMGRMRSQYGEDLPPAWYKVVKKLRLGGPAKLERGWNPTPVQE